MIDTHLEFGGRNKARRIARLIKKGKTEKAQKLTDKVAAKVAKLAAKGKVDSKRYAFLTEKLEKAGEAGMTIAELAELENITEEAVSDDAELKSEIDAETEDFQETWINGVPNWGVVVSGVALLAGIVWVAYPYIKKSK